MGKIGNCLSTMLFLLLSLLGGSVLGVVIGWVIWPVTYIDTDIVDLRAGYQDDYLVMVGDDYYVTRDFAKVQHRLDRLQDPYVSQRVVSLIRSKMAAGEEPQRLFPLVLLAEALQVGNQDMLDYVATVTPTFTPSPTATTTFTLTPRVTPTLTPTSTSVRTAAPTPDLVPFPTATVSDQYGPYPPESQHNMTPLPATPDLSIKPPMQTT